MRPRINEFINFRTETDTIKVEELKYHCADKITITDGTTHITISNILKASRFKNKKIGQVHNLNCLMEHIRRNFKVLIIEHRRYVDKGIWKNSTTYTFR